MKILFNKVIDKMKLIKKLFEKYEIYCLAKIKEAEGEDIFEEFILSEKIELSNEKPKETSTFQNLISNIDVNREELAKENEKETLQFEKKENHYECSFKGENFLFCNEGYLIFKRDFEKRDYSIIVKDGCLARENLENFKAEYFHEFLLKRDKRFFCIDNDCILTETEVEHINGIKTNNKKANLRIVLKQVILAE